MHSIYMYYDITGSNLELRVNLGPMIMYLVTCGLSTSYGTSNGLKVHKRKF
jgi:hypothetical protein